MGVEREKENGGNKGEIYLMGDGSGKEYAWVYGEKGDTERETERKSGEKGMVV